MILALLTGLATAGLVLSLGWLQMAGHEGELAANRVRRVTGSHGHHATAVETIRQGYSRTALGRWVEPRLQEAHLSLAAADATAIVLAAWAVCLVLGRRFLGLTSANAALVATLALFLLVRVYLSSRRGWLIKSLNDQLPQVAWMLGNAMRAGLNISQGLALAAREAPRPAGPIFQELCAQLALNRPLVEVLTESQERFQESREFRLLVLTILIQYRSGGNLAGALEELSRTLGQRKGVNEEVQSATAGPRAAAAILPFMPVVAAAIMNMAMPGFLNPIFSLWGLVLIVPFGVVQWLSYLFIRQVAAIRV